MTVCLKVMTSASSSLSPARDAVVESGIGSRTFTCRSCIQRAADALSVRKLSDWDPVEVADVATRAGVSVNTVQAWRGRGHLPPPQWIVSRQPVWNWSALASEVMPMARRIGGDGRADGTLVVQVEALPRSVTGVVFAVPGHQRQLVSQVDLVDDGQVVLWGNGESRKWFSPPIGRIPQVYVKAEYGGHAFLEKGRFLVTGDPSDTELMVFGPDKAWRVRVLCAKPAPARPALGR